jgi:hypothetical protein
MVLAGCVSGGGGARGPGSIVPPAIGFAQGTPPLSLDEANRTWQGARCELLIPLGLAQGPDADGYYGSGGRGMDIPAVDGSGFRLYPKVTGRDQLGVRVYDRKLQPGVRMTSAGWNFFDPAAGKGPHLDLSIEGTTERVRLEFAKAGSANTRDSLDSADLRMIEAWVRLQLLQVDAANEQLTARPTGARVQPAPRPAAPVPPAVTLSFGSVSVNPARVAAGGTVDLVVHYQTAGATSEVAEHWVLEQGGRPIWTAEERFNRAPGAQMSAKPLGVPGNAAPGIYTVRVELSTAVGSRVSGTALFEVTR